MKCKHVKQNIDHFLLEKRGPLTKKTSHHISECPDCREHYESTLLISSLSGSLREKEPTLSDPSLLTENIMLGINQIVEKKSTHTSIVFFTSINIQRFLAAASICLFLIFGYEQYRILSKINQLEMNNQNIGMGQQAQNSNLKGTMEGLLILSFKNENINPERIIKNLRLERYSSQELLIAFNQAKQGNFSNKELNQFLGSNFSSAETKKLIEKIKSYDTGLLKSNSFINN